MLGGAIDHHVARFARHRQRDLALQDRSDPGRRFRSLPLSLRAARGERGGGITAPEFIGRQDLRSGGERIVDGEDGRLLGDLDLGEAGGAAGGIAGFGDDREDHLAVELDAAVGENRIVAASKGCSH